MKNMSKAFEQKVINEGIVDTKKYRYTYSMGKIKRIELDKLDTTAALTDWQIVKEY